MNKGQIIELTVEDMLDDGRAFGRYEGCAVFIDSGVPGDLIEAEILKSKKSSCEAKLTRIVRPSADRIEARCPHAGKCGGCQLQELSYEAQKDLKKRQVLSKLKRLGGVDNPVVRDIIGADTLEYYRNKAVFAVGPHGEVGFVRKKTHYVIDVPDCMLQTDPAMVCAEALREYLRRYKNSSIRQLTVKTAFGTGEVMAVLESDKKDIPGAEDLISMMDDAVNSLTAESFFSLESVAVVHKGKCRTIAGKPTITESVDAGRGRVLNFEISPQSFYQVNPEQMKRLYGKVEEYADLSGSETVLDLYCGVGTIGLFLADKAEKVIGIESVKPAVIDANRNSVINGLINTRYICGNAEEELPGMMGLARLYKMNEVNERVERQPEIRIEKADVIVLDPPRAGCDKNLLDAAVKAEPSRIVYVSCDPGTMSRDIKYLTESGYEFIECTPVDQFPWTTHIEVVAKIQRR